jgi:hypothetical protein
MTITAPAAETALDAEPGTPTVTLTLTAADAMLAAKAALANCAPTNDGTPVIAGAHFSIVRGKLQILATDRYTASRHRVSAQHLTDDGRLAPRDVVEELSVIVPREALVWLSRNAQAFRRSTFGGKVVFDFDPQEPSGFKGSKFGKQTAGRVSITVAPLIGEFEALAATFPLTAGHFPPIARLIDDRTKADVGVLAFNPGLLARLAKFVPRDVPVRLEFTAGDRPDKPGPVVWTAADLALDGVMQPNLLLR